MEGGVSPSVGSGPSAGSPARLVEEGLQGWQPLWLCPACGVPER